MKMYAFWNNKEGIPFTKLSPGSVDMPGKRVQIRADYLQNCINAMNDLVTRL